LWKKADDLKNLNEIYDTCIKLDGSRCDKDKEITTGWCYHRGECHRKYFGLRGCYRAKKQRGVTKENRCTSLRNGICIAPEGIALCDCYPGYVGEQCDTYDPCARNPCGKASECVVIPDETEVKGDLSSQKYRCLCGMSDEIDEQNPIETKCVYSGTGNCSRAKNPCNRGECLSCQYSEQGDVLQLCNENEKKDGFRCICEPGFKPPYCEAPADACFNHLCINGAQCVAKSPFNYEYVTCFTNNVNDEAFDYFVIL
ncbi:EGF-like domain protein, partial [Ostertagia ostertagi]